MDKVVKTLREAIQLAGVKDGSRISFHHHLRNGDYVLNMVMAARAANVDVYDTPFTDVNDDEGIRVDAEFAKGLGFTGKASISPRHVGVINEVFSPTQKDIDYAYEVMEAIRIGKEQGKGAVSLHGKMIDAPIVARAQQTIDMAVALGLGREEA